jgi:hypothetical protein
MQWFINTPSSATSRTVPRKRTPGTSGRGIGGLAVGGVLAESLAHLLLDLLLPVTAVPADRFVGKTDNVAVVDLREVNQVSNDTGDVFGAPGAVMESPIGRHGAAHTPYSLLDLRCRGMSEDVIISRPGVPSEDGRDQFQAASDRAGKTDLLEL